MAEVIHGNASGNQLNAVADKTQVYGLSGNDTLISGDKSDVLLIGGSGDDSLVMMGGNGTLSGGAGSDTFELTYSADKPLSAVIEDFEPSNDRIIVNHDGDTAPQLTSSTLKSGDVVWKDGDGKFNLTLKSVRDNDYFDGDAPDEAWEVLRLTNVEREAQGLSLLTLSEGLTAGASIRVQEITGLAQTGALSNHTRPNGKGDWDTVLEGKYIHPGENLDGGASSPTEVMGHWMNSTSHRDNILDKNFLKLGVGYNYDDADSSNHRWYWTQLFANGLESVETVSLDSLSVAQVNPVTKAVTGDAAANTLSNANYGATIDALDGNDSISNSGLIASIASGAGDDTINNSGSFVTICAGLGNDKISLAGNVKENLIQYASGDGNDIIQGFRADSTLSISGDEFTPVIVGNDVIVSVGTDSITLKDAASLSAVNIDGTRSKLYILTEGNDTYQNTIDGATIQALGGNDSIDNREGGLNVSISNGDGNDYIRNAAQSVTIAGGTGADSIFNYTADNVTINGGVGNDSINNWLSDSVMIDAGDGNDSIENMDSKNVSINAGAGDDIIHNWSSTLTINGGTGNDSITNYGANVWFQYTNGDGSDVIKGFRADSTLSISGGSYVRSTVNNDIIVAVGDDSITLLGATSLESVNIIGEGSEGISVNNMFVTLTAGNDTYNNTLDDATIYAYAGNDTIMNSGDSVSIDTGLDNDLISLSSAATDNIIVYRAGDGNDTIHGFNATDTLKINEVTEASTQTIGSDIVVNVGTGTITLTDAATLSTVNIVVNWNTTSAADKLITLSESNDHYSNWNNDVTIAALGGEDDISNSGFNVSISAGTGNDEIRNDGSNISILGGAGNDYVYNNGSSVKIDGGTGDDTISNNGDSATIDGNDGNDRISNHGSTVTVNSGNGDDEISNWDDGNSVTIDAGNGNDSITNYGSNVSIDAGNGNDDIDNKGSNVSINTGDGVDTINNSGESVTILGGAGNNSIKNGIARIGMHIEDTLTFVDSISGGDSVSIAGGVDNDTIYNGGLFVTINGGAGNDRISLLSGAKNNVIEYTAGDGFDTVWGYDNTTTLKIGDGTGSYSQTVSGDDLIINVGNGSITLKDAREKPAPIILGESKSDGGGSNSGGDNGGHSSGGNGGNGDNTKGNISAGGNINTGGSINTNDNSHGYSGGNDNASATTYSSPFDTLKTTAATNLNFYAGGNQIIADYQSGQKIMLGTLPTGYIFGGDNFALTSTTGTLLIRDAKDKIIAFTDGAGNDFLKAYSATNAGLIDGRGLTGFEVISGSDAGSDLIFAGDNGSSLWGGNGVHSDTLVGGGGMDIFVGGKTQGADTFLNASANDIVFLSDSTLEDVVATAGNDNAVAVAFNTGNVIMVGSSDTLSAAFMLADGSAYRYNHVAKTWQTA